MNWNMSKRERNALANKDAKSGDPEYSMTNPRDKSSSDYLRSKVSHLPKGVKLTPEGHIGQHRGMEAEELGTFKNASITKSYYKSNTVRQTYEPFVQPFTPREKP